jgi:hypothetical protein
LGRVRPSRLPIPAARITICVVITGLLGVLVEAVALRGGFPRGVHPLFTDRPISGHTVVLPPLYG